MALFARLETSECLENRRYAARRTLKFGAALADPGVEVTVHNLSATGLLIETPGDLAEGESLIVDLPEIGPTPATVVWSRDGLFGCEFASAIPRSAISAASLRNPIIEAVLSLHSGLAGESPAHAAMDGVEADDRLPLRSRVLAIVCLAALSWTLIGGLAVWFF